MTSPLCPGDLWAGAQVLAVPISQLCGSPAPLGLQARVWRMGWPTANGPAPPRAGAPLVLTGGDGEGWQVPEQEGASASPGEGQRGPRCPPKPSSRGYSRAPGRIPTFRGLHPLAAGRGGRAWWTEAKRMRNRRAGHFFEHVIPAQKTKLNRYKKMHGEKDPDCARSLPALRPPPDWQWVYEYRRTCTCVFGC